MSPLVIGVLVGFNLALFFVLLAMPFGRRTISLSANVHAPRSRLWDAVWPFGGQAGWSGELVGVRPVDDRPDMARLSLSWEGRDGRSIERVVRFSDLVEGERFTRRVIEDTSLDAGFWADFHDGVELEDEGGGVTRVTVQASDTYSGLAFLAFRYFAMRRELGRLKAWAETGRFRERGMIEHPATQFGLAAVSAIILWPFFGLTAGGLVAAALLTLVVGLHELGHLAAFRVMGHRRVRMIFVPLLGGVAIGSRPYDSRFEVAFVALMGAGFSAFLVPIAISASSMADHAGDTHTATMLATLAGFAALFNLANLVPVWKFDGGQVLRQVFYGEWALSLASFAILGAFMWLGWEAGFSPQVLMVAGAVFAILSVMTTGSGVKPRHELKPITARERVAVAAALVSVFAIHGFGVLWAASRLT